MARPRRRRAERMRSRSVTNCGAKVTAMTMDRPNSYRADGTALSRRAGDAKELAAPMQMRMVASRMPS